MTMARWEQTIVNAAGVPQPGASVQVQREEPGLPLQPLYADREGTTLIANPFTADGDGIAALHCAGGAYRITITSGAYTRVLRYVPIGLGAEFDGPLNVVPAGAWDEDTTYAANRVVTSQGGSWIAKRANTNAPPPTLPTVENDDWLLLSGPGAPGTGIADNVIELAEVSTPEAPSSGSHKAYYKADGKLYTLAGAGAERAYAMQDVPPVTLTGDDETAALEHAGQIVEMTHASPNIYTIPANSDIAFPVGTVINVVQYGAGTTTIVADTGVTLNGVSAGEADISDRYQGVSLYKRDTNEWVMSGAHGDVA